MLYMINSTISNQNMDFNMFNNNMTTPILFRQYARGGFETIEENYILTLKEIRDNLPIINKKMSKLINILYYTPDELELWISQHRQLVYTIGNISEDIYKCKIYLNSNYSYTIKKELNKLFNNFEYIYFYSQLYKIIELCGMIDNCR